METIILDKLKAIVKEKIKLENSNLDAYELELEWKLLKAQSDLLWELLDATKK